MGYPLRVLDGRYAICRLAPEVDIPAWATCARFFSVTRTAGELSVLCPEDRVPEGHARSEGWRCIQVVGPLDLALTGVLASVLQPLAQAQIPVLALATHETDYIFVRQLAASAQVLLDAGHALVP